jgi:hypothetical protein
MAMLILERCDLSDTDLLAFLQPDPDHQAVVPWPQLHTLRLVNNSFDYAALKALLAMHSIQALHVIDCRGDCPEGWMKDLYAIVPNI